jgi:hypothetical protein
MTSKSAVLARFGRDVKDAAALANDKRREQTAAEPRLMKPRTEADGAHGNAAVASQIAELQKQLQTAQADLKSARVENLELSKRLDSALIKIRSLRPGNHGDGAPSHHPKSKATPRRAKVHLSQSETNNATATVAAPAPVVSSSESVNTSILAWLNAAEATVTTREEAEATLIVQNAPSAAPSAPRSINANALQRARRAQSARHRVKVG